jgi:dipeptidyl-peptidase-4
MCKINKQLQTLLLMMFLGSPLAVHAQGTQADYARSEKLRKLTANKVFKTRIEPHWFAGNTRFWYRNDLSDGAREFIMVDAERGTRDRAFDHARLAKRLAKATNKAVNATHLPLKRITFDMSSEAVWFRALDKDWKCELRGYELTNEKPEPVEKKNVPQSKSKARANIAAPRKWAAFVKDHNIYLRDRKSGDEFALSVDGTADDAYSSRVYWSPDSSKLVALRTRKGTERKVFLVEAAPKDQLQPKLHSYNYRKPGDQIPITKPHLFDVAARKPIPISDDLFPNPWSVGEIRWQPDSSRFTFLYNQRGHQVLRIVAVDALTGKAWAIVSEQSQTFIDYAYKKFTRYLDDTHEIIWMSERDGWNHLYLYDLQAGQVKNQITKGRWVLRGVGQVDEEQRQIWFRACGVYPDQDPYSIHYGRVNFDGTGLTFLTAGDGTHSIRFSPDRKYIIDNYSRVDLPPVTELRRVADGKLVCVLERADWSELVATGWKGAERFVAKGRDGKTDIHGIIWRPTNFDPQKSYPIIEKIYAGPHGAFVPKRFAAYSKVQALAELGFIVVQIDGMGTNWRRKTFHDVCWKNLGDSGFPDRILWIKAVAKKYPFMDVTRVGIYGGSAGGQSSTRAMLAHGDFYKVAVSDCGCHDNRMDKIWWNEAWMGWPIGPHYGEQSNVTQAHKLTGKLFLVVGAMDRNVDPASTMQVVDALIKADKDFDLLVVPGGGHGIAESRYGTRRRSDFFVRHLLGVEPRTE